MLLNFKDIGDIASLDNYNALVYLMLQNNQLKERFLLTPNSFTGNFGIYTLPHGDEISLKGDFYIVTDVTKNINLNIDSSFVGGFKLTLSVYSDYYEEEKVDENGNIPEANVRELVYYSNNLDGRQQIIIPLADMSAGEYISIYANMEMKYEEPIIDKVSGSIYDDISQDLIKTSEDLILAIVNAPQNKVTTLYLKPGISFELFDLEEEEDPKNKNIIIDNKTIELISGSIPAELDAGGLHRHFYVTETGSLTLNNIVLNNGYSLHDNLDNGYGGSIYVKSERDGSGIKRSGNLNTLFCRFINNRANVKGGAIYSEDGILDLKETIFYNNTASSSNNVLGDGGAIYNEGAS